MKDQNDNKTVDWVGQPKPKYIQTDLGREKLCIECDEYWPLDHEFWFCRYVKIKKGVSIRWEAACKCCYSVRYRPQRVKGTNKIKSGFEKQVAAC